MRKSLKTNTSSVLACAVLFAACGDTGDYTTFSSEPLGSPPRTIIDDFEEGVAPGTPCPPSAPPLGFCTFSDAGSSVTITGVATPPAPNLPAVGTPNNVLQMDVETIAFAGFTRGFTNAAGDAWTPQDWSGNEGISLWMFGTGSGSDMFIDILDNRNPGSTTDDAERWSVAFADDFAGWQLFEFPFTSFTRKEIGNGAPNDGLGLLQVHGYSIGALGTDGPRTFYIDEVGISGSGNGRDDDGDGIPNGEDLCPLEPGPASNDGCPVADDDGDGIPNEDDLCPLEPAPDSSDGCPVRLPTISLSVSGAVDLVLEGVLDTDGFHVFEDPTGRIRVITGMGTLGSGEEISLIALGDPDQGYGGLLLVHTADGLRLRLPFKKAALNMADGALELSGSGKWYRWLPPRGLLVSEWTISIPTGPFCGDGAVDPGEECDPPNGVTCDASCMSVAPTVVTVNNLDDDGPGSLREALALVADGGTLTFDPSLAGGTLTLTSGQLLVDRSVTIDASAAAPITISGGNVSRVFAIGAGLTVSMNDLVVRDGGGLEIGGGILNNGVLSLERSVVTDNVERSPGPANFAFGGGGIYNGDGATLNLTDSTVSNNTTISQPGGGVHGSFNSTINITNSVVSGNVSGDLGGGLRTRGDATIIGSTISGNTSTTWHGGGIFATDGTVTIENSSIIDNVAPSGTAGGIMVATFGAPVLVTLQDSTVTGNVSFNCRIEGGAAAVLTLLGGNTIDDGSCGLPP